MTPEARAETTPTAAQTGPSGESNRISILPPVLARTSNTSGRQGDSGDAREIDPLKRRPHPFVTEFTTA